ncbi:MAG: DUF2330 domain-containing protein [Planctomycetota bacterium]|jgi:hypothetical protein
MKRTGILIALAIASLAALLPARTSHACCAAGPAGADVKIADQEVLLVWDPASRTEHFIRRARFSTGEQAFGFIVPTPTVPDIAGVPGEIFDVLATRTRPRPRFVTEGTEFSVSSIFLQVLSKSRSADTGSVRVLAETDVAGYRATVLEATDPAALTDWLKTHQFSVRPEIETWVAPYVQAGYKLTAFRYLREGEDNSSPQEAGTQAIRLSFKTDHPFFPYRVPEDRRSDPAKSLLRLYVASPEPVRAVLREAGQATDAKAPEQGAFPGELKGRVSYKGLEGLATLALPSAPEAPPVWLTVYEDEAWPSSALDLSFDTDLSPEAATVIKPEIVITRPRVIMIPLELVIAVAGLLGLAVFFARRRRLRQEPSTL